MSNDVWNDDIAYAFSTHKTFMQILGIWPLQKKTIFTIIHWSVITILQFLSLLFLYMELTAKHGDTGRDMDAIIYAVCVVSMKLKYFCVVANQQKLAQNINAAFVDWLSAKNNEKAYKIMKEQSSRSRLYTFIMIYSCYICGFLYIISVAVVNDYKEMIKMLLSNQFYVFTYASDILQTQSESIIYTIYSSTWHEMSLTMTKDLLFIMMRIQTPLRISAGKFFTLTRITITDILRTVTYKSFLQMTIN
ncbi:uncharacterized protein LOC113003172 [Solenopsis invicta]|uniref:uncharacterized protein LOC113003172 n=1 Tax=Solenopsis invicta TaxID=13686 RepID=UPI000E3404EC|nr:uncharacterized protein LOC113003172 [Solenopsis invicta]